MIRYIKLIEFFGIVIIVLVFNVSGCKPYKNKAYTPIYAVETYDEKQIFYGKEFEKFIPDSLFIGKKPLLVSVPDEYQALFSSTLETAGEESWADSISLQNSIRLTLLETVPMIINVRRDNEKAKVQVKLLNCLPMALESLNYNPYRRVVLKDHFGVGRNDTVYEYMWGGWYRAKDTVKPSPKILLTKVYEISSAAFDSLLVSLEKNRCYKSYPVQVSYMPARINVVLWEYFIDNKYSFVLEEKDFSKFDLHRICRPIAMDLEKVEMF